MNAWNYNDNGFANNNNVRNALTVRAVSKLEQHIAERLKMDELVIEKAYKKARKHNRRSADMIPYEYDRCVNICSLTSAMNAKSYTPDSNYSYVNNRGSKPREVFAAEPDLKTTMAFLLDRIGPLIEIHMSPHTYNNRVGMGVQAAVNKVIENIYACSEGYTKDVWIIKYDFEGYFPNINRDIAFEQLRQIVQKEYHGIDKDEVFYSLMVSIYTDPERAYRRSPIYEWKKIKKEKSVYTKAPGHGALIGFPLWQIETSLYPVEIDDFVSQYITPYYVRYVDDSVLVVDNKEMALSMMEEVRRLCAKLEITMHPRKFYCQPYQRGLEFLGYHIRPLRVHLNRRIVNRAFMAAKDRIKSNPKFVDSINSYLGMIKSTSDIYISRKLLDSITRKGIKKDYVNLKISLE